MSVGISARAPAVDSHHLGFMGKVKGAHLLCLVFDGGVGRTRPMSIDTKDQEAR